MRGRVFLGRYEVVRQLGEGGMGKVYLARQLDLNRPVVLKVMHEHIAADPHFQQRFQREMLLMARFQHPYAVTLYDAAVNAEEGHCIIMEYVRGETLASILQRNHHLTPYRVGRLLGQLCEVLQEAHAQGIIHRDLTPSNLMVLDADTPYEKIKVMDFGLAKLISARSLRQMGDSKPRSSNEYIIGTPAYMSPEQARGEETDHRGDLYSVGVILYELLTGRLPFQGLSTMDMLLAHALDQPPSMRESEVWVPPSIERVVMQCLEKQPDKRPASARELADLYERALREIEAETAAEEAPTEAEAEVGPPPIPEASDPNVAAFQVQAWMPESIAAYKLRGFIHDVGGQVVESVPGRIRVFLGGRGCAYGAPQGRLAWLGLGGKSGFDLELRLYQPADTQQSYLWITVLLRYLGRTSDGSWRRQADQIFRDLRGYLISSHSKVVLPHNRL
jgi:serine/threonine-protein kinase